MRLLLRRHSRSAGCFTYPSADKFVIECNVLHKNLERTIREGLEQTAGYMNRWGSQAGHLVIFDRRKTM